jgi:hypothetical protein
MKKGKNSYRKIDDKLLKYIKIAERWMKLTMPQEEVEKQLEYIYKNIHNESYGKNNTGRY